MTTKKNVGGRPRKAPEEKASVNFTMRLRPAVYENLKSRAEANGRSISAEAERLLTAEDVLVHDIGKTLSIVLFQMESRLGRRFDSDDDAKTQCRTAAEYTLNLMLGAYADPQMLLYKINSDMNKLAGNKGIFDDILGSPTPSLDEVKKEYGTRQSSLEGFKKIQEIFGHKDDK